MHTAVICKIINSDYIGIVVIINYVTIEVTLKSHI